MTACFFLASVLQAASPRFLSQPVFSMRARNVRTLRNADTFESMSLSATQSWYKQHSIYSEEEATRSAIDIRDPSV